MTLRYYDAGLGVSSWEIDFFGRIQKPQGERAGAVPCDGAGPPQRPNIACGRGRFRLPGLRRRPGEPEAQRDHARGQAGNLQPDRAPFRAWAPPPRSTCARRKRPWKRRGSTWSAYTRAVALDENALDLLVGATAPPELLPDELSAVTPPRDISPGSPPSRSCAGPTSSRPSTSSRPPTPTSAPRGPPSFPASPSRPSVGTSSLELSGLFKAGSGAWTFAPQITLPIFDAGSRWASLKAAKTDRDIQWPSTRRPFRPRSGKWRTPLPRGGPWGIRSRRRNPSWAPRRKPIASPTPAT